MAQFDIYRLRGGQLVVDCQADLMAHLPSRLVAPLSADEQTRVPRLMPTFAIEGREMTMLTPLVRGVSSREIAQTIGSLADQDYAVKIALEMLTSGF